MASSLASATVISHGRVVDSILSSSLNELLASQSTYVKRQSGRACKTYRDHKKEMRSERKCTFGTSVLRLMLMDGCGARKGRSRCTGSTNAEPD
jgi:hypothetical protein